MAHGQPRRLFVLPLLLQIPRRAVRRKVAPLPHEVPKLYSRTRYDQCRRSAWLGIHKAVLLVTVRRDFSFSLQRISRCPSCSSRPEYDSLDGAGSDAIKPGGEEAIGAKPRCRLKALAIGADGGVEIPAIPGDPRRVL